MGNASLCFILDEGLETFLEIRDLEIYILLIYMVTRLQNYRTYRLLALFPIVFSVMDVWNFAVSKFDYANEWCEGVA